MSGVGAEGQADFLLSQEPDVGLNPKNLWSWSEAPGHPITLNVFLDENVLLMLNIMLLIVFFQTASVCNCPRQDTGVLDI